MTAALVGLVGVIAGALLGGLLNYQVERSKRHAMARAARRLIAAELTSAEKRIDSAIQAGEWWSGDLQNEAYTSNILVLAVEIPRTLVDELANAYGLIERWNLDREAYGGPGKPIPDKQVLELKDHKERFAILSVRVREAVRRSLPVRVLGVPFKIAAWAGLFLVVGALLWTLFASRANLTDRTIAAALQTRLGSRTLVDCSSDRDRWLCDVSYPPEPSRACIRRSAAITIVPQAVTVAYAASTPSKSRAKPCKPAPSPAKVIDYEVARGPDGPVATASAGEIERGGLAGGIPLNPGKKSLWDRLIEAINGD